jgi:hypothetical protein
MQFRGIGERLGRPWASSFGVGGHLSQPIGVTPFVGTFRSQWKAVFPRADQGRADASFSIHGYMSKDIIHWMLSLIDFCSVPLNDDSCVHSQMA